MTSTRDDAGLDEAAQTESAETDATRTATAAASATTDQDAKTSEATSEKAGTAPENPSLAEAVGSRGSSEAPDSSAPRAKLAAKGLRKVYRGRAVVDNVDIEIEQGEIVGLLGPNGAGKTTTFYMVVGLTTPDAGDVYMSDVEITALPMYLRARKGISYLPQEASIFRKMSVENNLRAVFETIEGLSLREQARRAELLLEEFGLTHVRKSPGFALSGGERRRVEIARALAIDPKFILLDEPFAGIDPIAVLDIQKIIQHLRHLGIGVLITDHNVRETLKITDRAYIINNGEILRSGAPDELSSDPQVRKIYLGEEFRL